MDNNNQSIDTKTLMNWIENDPEVLVLDVRPKDQREEWHIPGSVHLDAYKRLNEGDLTVLNEVEIPEGTKVVTVCAAGRTSKMASEQLRKKGIEAYSLEGGMKGWTSAWNTALISDGNAIIVQIRRTGKGCLSYMVGSGGESVVIDASLDIAVYQETAERFGWNIKYVMDTHIHADHLSRSFHLAATTGAELFMPQQDKLRYHFTPITAETEFKFGVSVLRPIQTPGHTMESVTYLLNDGYLFTGDTLFTDGVGRPDLKANREEARKKAGILYSSLMHLIKFPEPVIILPGHVSKPVPFDKKPIAATIEEVKKNLRVLSLSREVFIETIIERIPPAPPNFLKVVELNLNADIDSIDAAEVEAGANRCAIS